MPNIHVLLGPPGTGKTTTILNQIDELLGGGARPYEIGFYSFTKSACREARERASTRFDIDPDSGDLDHFRTLHSQAFEFGRDRGTVMTDKHWKLFEEWSCCKFSDSDGDDSPFLPNLTTDGDVLRHIYDLSRLCRCSISKAMLRVSRAEHIHPSDVAAYARKLEEFKEQNGLLDFTDMLIFALKSPRRPSVRFVFVDEAQDNCQLQWDLVDHWFSSNPRTELVTVAGDDDQAIFEFAGAEPAHLIRLSGQHPTRVLEQSYRIPGLVHGFAERIIGQNRNRIPKTYRPRDEAGELGLSSDTRGLIETATPETPVMVLVRNKMFASRVYAECLSGGIRFVAECGSHAPLQSEASRDSFLAVACLRAGYPVRPTHFWRLMTEIPEKIGDTVYRPRGVLAASERNTALVTLDRALNEFKLDKALPVFLGPEPFALFRQLESSEREYLQKILARDPRLSQPPIVTITTLHRSKGRESHTVIILSDVTSAVQREIGAGSESENRLAYVGATRARHNLTIVRPTTRRFYDYESYLAGKSWG